jgi:hypothetical protein
MLLPRHYSNGGWQHLFSSRLEGPPSRHLQDGSKISRTTPLHPQSDGMVERYMKTIEEHLRKVVSTHQRDWDERVPIFLLAYRASTHDTTGMTPANMVFGRELRLPLPIVRSSPRQGTVNNGLCHRPGGATTRHPPIRPAAPEGGQRPHEGPLQSPGQFSRIPGRRPSLAVPPDPDQRKVTKAVVGMGRPVQGYHPD